MASLYKISNLLSSHFCKRFHRSFLCNLRQIRILFKEPLEIAHRSDEDRLSRRRCEGCSVFCEWAKLMNIVCKGRLRYLCDGQVCIRMPTDTL